MLGSFINSWQQEKHHTDFTLAVAAAPALPPSLTEEIFLKVHLGLTCAHKEMVSWCIHWFSFSSTEASLFLFLAFKAKSCPPVFQGKHFH